MLACVYFIARGTVLLSNSLYHARLMYIDILFLKLLVPCSSKGLQNIFGLGI